MKETNDILDKIGRRSGMTVPEGYFDNFVAKMSETIGQIPLETEPETDSERSFWQKVRPYAYMAAMFAGIWCMMKMFGMLSGQGPDLTDINNYPGVLTALNDCSFVNDCICSEIDQYELIEDMYRTSTDIPADSIAFDNTADSLYMFNDSI